MSSRVFHTTQYLLHQFTNNYTQRHQGYTQPTSQAIVSLRYKGNPVGFGRGPSWGPCPRGGGVYTLMVGRRSVSPMAIHQGQPLMKPKFLLQELKEITESSSTSSPSRTSMPKSGWLSRSIGLDALHLENGTKTAIVLLRFLLPHSFSKETASSWRRNIFGGHGSHGTMRLMRNSTTRWCLFDASLVPSFCNASPERVVLQLEEVPAVASTSTTVLSLSPAQTSQIFHLSRIGW